MDASRYKFFRVPKRTTGYRLLCSPDDELKKEQRAILGWLKGYGVGPSKYAYGFVKNRSAADHARLHTGKKVVVRIDIKDFFPSISERQVVSKLMEEGIESSIAAHIGDVCTIKEDGETTGWLPQGAPTSPFLSNVVFRKTDYRLAAYARKHDITYSRYADDLIFSSDKGWISGLYYPVKLILEDDGFEINEKKYKVYRSSNRQLVTGIVVNEKATLPRTVRRNLRAAVHNAYTAVMNNEELPENWFEVLGKVGYLQGVDRRSGDALRVKIDKIKDLELLREKLRAETHVARTAT